MSSIGIGEGIVVTILIGGTMGYLIYMSYKGRQQEKEKNDTRK